MRYICLFIAVIVLLPSLAVYGTDNPAGSVNVWGALRAMMHEGATGPVVSLSSLLPDTTLYAVGALAGLAGEVTIVGGTAYLSRPEAEGAVTEVVTRTDAEVALLVATSVSRWTGVITNRPIPFAELDEAIRGLAAARGIDPDERFMFLIEAEVEELEWHVIDGRKLGDGPSSHEAHRAAGVTERRERAQAVLVGFYSRNDHGVFTHMDSNTHVHCVVQAPLASGHVDHVVVPAGTTVRFGMVD